jgi:hypothetical protein
MSRRKTEDFTRSTRMPRTRAQSSLRHQATSPTAIAHTDLGHGSAGADVALAAENLLVAQRRNVMLVY